MAGLGLFCASCTASLPPPVLPATTGTASAPGALITNDQSSTVALAPAKTYTRISKHAARCWFGPFGALHKEYMMHAIVPPPASSLPVEFTVHRRAPSLKKPWGPRLLRLTLRGSSTTTMEFQNLGLDIETEAWMTSGLTKWANGSSVCPVIPTAAPPSLVARQPQKPARRN